MLIELEDSKSRAGIGFSSGVFNEKGCSEVEVLSTPIRVKKLLLFWKKMQKILTFVIPGGICHIWVAVDVPTVMHKSE